MLVNDVVDNDARAHRGDGKPRGPKPRGRIHQPGRGRSRTSQFVVQTLANDVLELDKQLAVASERMQQRTMLKTSPAGTRPNLMRSVSPSHSDLMRSGSRVKQAPHLAVNTSPRQASHTPRSARYDEQRGGCCASDRFRNAYCSSMYWSVFVGFMGSVVLVVLQRPVFFAFVDEKLTANGTDSVDYPNHFELNEPVGAFVGIMALIFALLYNSIFNDAQHRLAGIRTNLAQEAGGVHTAMLLVRTLDARNNVNQTKALLLFSHYIETLSCEVVRRKIQNGCGSERRGLVQAFLGGSDKSASVRNLASNRGVQDAFAFDSGDESNIEMLYAAIPFLALISSDGDGDEMDRVLVQRTVDALNNVAQARQHRLACEAQDMETPVVALLMFLALSVSFGILFMQMGSLKLQLAFVILVCVGLFVSMLILIDVWQPWSGFIQVNTTIFDQVRHDISNVLFQERSTGEHDTGIDSDAALERAVTTQARRSSIVSLMSPTSGSGAAEAEEDLASSLIATLNQSMPSARGRASGRVLLPNVINSLDE